MAVGDRHLTLRSCLVRLGDSGKIERGSKSSAVGSGLAVNEDRLWRVAHDLNQLLGLRLRQFAAGRHAKIDMVDIELLGLGDFPVVPMMAAVVAPQIDDGLDAILLLKLGYRLCGGLGGAIELARDDRMEVCRPDHMGIEAAGDCQDDSQSDSCVAHRTKEVTSKL
ncbi:hypothetical protein RHSP_13925 [Rhizobium freirei PRF 81]|uniref:Uncharacterized protein n=1 Tax=Rhizobium freirei PRF 81 TaxID=363754 RepID=N6U2W9_9HYPH|nr:hypothetical protein RHSP_13925 [Rhizobium freirei PRF 81]